LITRSRPTIREVAARAGVSHQTVSRVINGFERVNPETRQRVEAAIAELGYQPNAIARSMAQGRTHTLACLAPNLTDFTFANIIEGAENEARKHGYFLLTASAPDQAGFVSLVDQLLASQRAEGLVLITPFLDSYHTRLPRYVRAVYVSADPHLDGASSVMLDDFNAGAMATRHLVDLGHREIALITGPLIEDCTRNRMSGYQAALQAAGIEPNPKLIAEGDWSASSGYRSVSQMLAEKVRFSAIFAQNDRMAIGAIHALRQAGKHVPQDVSVIGFDDMPLASYFDPPITTIQQDTFRMGREAASLLIDAIEQPEPVFQKVLIGAELVVRQSTRQISV
jgi:DNA-binding LacI/PurR family transcriptional regulator